MNTNIYRNKLPFASKSVNPKVYADYMNEEARLKDQFKKDLFVELGIENNPKRELLFNAAWDSGHSGGYSEVCNEAFYMVDLIRE